MDNTTTSSTANPATATPVTPFPESTGGNGPAANAPPDRTDTIAAGTAASVSDGLVKRAASGAHDAIDRVAAKISSITGGLQGGVSEAGDTRDEWIESARDVIRQHPFAAVASALVIGAALLSLNSSRRD